MNFNMKVRRMKKERANHYIEDWRRFRGYTQSQLAAFRGVTPSNINLIESGKTGYTKQSLERIASALYIEPIELLKTDPFEPELRNEHPNLSAFKRSVTKLGEDEKKLISNLVASMSPSVSAEARKRRDIPHYFSEWRQYRGYTQTELGKKIGTSASNVHHIEIGKTAYTQWSLEKMASILGVEPYEILSVDPYNPNNDMDISDGDIRQFSSLNVENQNIVLDILKKFVAHNELRAKSRDENRESMSSRRGRFSR